MISKLPYSRIFIAGLALVWLMVQASGTPRLLGIASAIVITSLMFPERPRRRPILASVGFLLLFVFLLTWIVLLTGHLHGAAAFALMIGGILLMALAVPLMYSLTFPDGGQP